MPFFLDATDLADNVTVSIEWNKDNQAFKSCRVPQNNYPGSRGLK
jgi:hypothetical protein